MEIRCSCGLKEISPPGINNGENFYLTLLEANVFPVKGRLRQKTSAADRQKRTEGTDR